jgi:hypothetical protein
MTASTCASFMTLSCWGERAPAWALFRPPMAAVERPATAFALIALISSVEKSASSLLFRVAI